MWGTVSIQCPWWKYCFWCHPFQDFLNLNNHRWASDFYPTSNSLTLGQSTKYWESRNIKFSSLITGWCVSWQDAYWHCAGSKKDLCCVELDMLQWNMLQGCWLQVCAYFCVNFHLLSSLFWCFCEVRVADILTTSQVGNLSPGCSFTYCHFVLCCAAQVNSRVDFAVVRVRRLPDLFSEHMHKCEMHLATMRKF